MPPTGKPYPSWMSGIASAASTIPGRVATFWSCSSERSARMASMSSASANTRAGTRMSVLARAGISQSRGPTGRSSDIEHEVGAPPVGVAVEAQLVVGHRLDQMGGTAAAPLHRRIQPVGRQAEVGDSSWDEALGLGPVDQLAEPLDKQQRALWRRDRHLAAVGRPAVPALLQQLAQRFEGPGEDRLLAGGAQLELELAGVVDPTVHVAVTHAQSSPARGAYTGRWRVKPCSLWASSC